MVMTQAEAVPSCVSSDRWTDEGQEDLFRYLSARQFASSCLSQHGKKEANEGGESRALGLKEET